MSLKNKHGWIKVDVRFLPDGVKCGKGLQFSQSQTFNTFYDARLDLNKMREYMNKIYAPF